MNQKIECYILDTPRPTRTRLIPETNELIRLLNSLIPYSNQHIKEEIKEEKEHDYQISYTNWLKDASNKITLYIKNPPAKEYGSVKSIKGPILDVVYIPDELIKLISEFAYSKNHCDIWFMFYKDRYISRNLYTAQGHDLDIIPFESNQTNTLHNGDIVVLNPPGYMGEKYYIYMDNIGYYVYNKCKLWKKLPKSGYWNPVYDEISVFGKPHW